MVDLPPYVLVAMIAFGAACALVDEVKEPVKAAVVKVEHGAKKVGRGVVHVLTFGKK